MIILENDALRIEIDPQTGGAITSVVHRKAGLSVLGRTPWDTMSLPSGSGIIENEDGWLRTYPGGWPLLFPNGGDACEFEGVLHGFHGEASISPWQCETDGVSAWLARRFYSLPVTMERKIEIAGDSLLIDERVALNGDMPVRVMWTHHPSFGGDLLDGEFEIQTGARKVVVDDTFEMDANPLVPGAEGQWPVVPGKTGPYDLSRPVDGKSTMAYLYDFDDAMVSIRRTDGSIGATLTWDENRFPYAWMWCELGGTLEPPWFGRVRLIGLEPSTSWPGTGLADIARRGGPLLTLRPGETATAWLKLQVFEPKDA